MIMEAKEEMQATVEAGTGSGGGVVGVLARARCGAVDIAGGLAVKVADGPTGGRGGGGRVGAAEEGDKAERRK